MCPRAALHASPHGARERAALVPRQCAMAASSATAAAVLLCPGVKLVERSAKTVKEYLQGKDDKEDVAGNGFGPETCTLDKDILHLQEIFPGG